MAKKKITVEQEIVETGVKVDVKSTFGEKVGIGLWTAATIATGGLAGIGLGRKIEKVSNRKKLVKKQMEAKQLEAEAAAQAEAKAKPKAKKATAKKTASKTTTKSTTKATTAKKTNR